MERVAMSNSLAQLGLGTMLSPDSHRLCDKLGDVVEIISGKQPMRLKQLLQEL